MRRRERESSLESTDTAEPTACGASRRSGVRDGSLRGSWWSMYQLISGREALLRMRLTSGKERRLLLSRRTPTSRTRRSSLSSSSSILRFRAPRRRRSAVESRVHSRRDLRQLAQGTNPVHWGRHSGGGGSSVLSFFFFFFFFFLFFFFPPPFPHFILSFPLFSQSERGYEGRLVTFNLRALHALQAVPTFLRRWESVEAPIPGGAGAKGRLLSAMMGGGKGGAKEVSP